jgi:hypothetical protein
MYVGNSKAANIMYIHTYACMYVCIMCACVYIPEIRGHFEGCKSNFQEISKAGNHSRHRKRERARESEGERGREEGREGERETGRGRGREREREERERREREEIK